MNIIKKIKNWLIHKLGGYTIEEYRDELFKRADMVRTGSELLEKYTTEHENYLAMLSLYNTTVEQMQTNSMGVAGAIDTIKAYCNGKDGCDNCALYDASKGCKVAMCPCYWG